MDDTDQPPAKVRKLTSAQSEESGSQHNEQDPAETAKQNTVVPDAHGPDEVNGTPNPDSVSIEESEKPLSKNQQKKLRKRQEWEAGRQYRKAKRKEKTQHKKAQKAAAARASPPVSQDNLKSSEHPLNNNFNVTNSETNEVPKEKKQTSRPVQLPLTFILDCSFESYMTEKELISLASQITRCYSENRNARFKTHLVVSSWGGKMRERFETVLSSHHLGWKGTRFFEEGWVDAARVMDGVMRGEEGGRVAGALAGCRGGGEKNEGAGDAEIQVNGDSVASSRPPTSEQDLKGAEAENEPTIHPEPVPALPKTSIIYLTADSPNTITSLVPNTTYIIGGLVDKNRHKGLCYRQACEASSQKSHGESNISIPTAKLPIGEYMTMQSRTVLTVNHVVEIMLRWLESGDWGEAFLSVIPKRKGGRLKEGERERDGGGKEEDGEGDGENGEEGKGEGEGEGEEEGRDRVSVGVGEEEASRKRKRSEVEGEKDGESTEGMVAEREEVEHNGGGNLVGAGRSNSLKMRR